MKPSLSMVLTGIVIAYVLHSVYTIYTLFTPPVCSPGEDCIKPYLQTNPKLTLALFTSTKKRISSASDVRAMWQWEEFDVTLTYDVTVNVTLPAATRNNGSLYVHAFLMPKFQKSQSVDHMMSSSFSYYASAALTSYLVPEAETFNLLGSENPQSQNETPANVKAKNKSQAKSQTHWRTKLRLNVMGDLVPIPTKRIPTEILNFIRFSPENYYLPILYVDNLNIKTKDYKPIHHKQSVVELAISYSPMSYGKLRFFSQVEMAMQLMNSLGFKERDLDEVKGLITDTNHFLLCLTFVISFMHLFFDFLAFKNDISFWRKRQSMVGLSTRTLLWRCVSHFIVFIYLMDEGSSLLILIPAGVGTVIELWKLTKAFKVTFKFYGILPGLQFGSATVEERATEEFDALSMRYLSYLLYPLCAAGAVYSLMFTPHKGWYSWCIQSLVNGVYAFGFLFMLPQLFVNYKLKSVAHLPWRAFTYKAFNTFIDDVFAFIITMPTAHRVACFRDDVVFLVYLYQRWLYPVDKSRVNEFGVSFEDEVNKNKVSESKNKKTKTN